MLCGRFSEALRCYHRSSQAPDSGVANNKANVARVLERIGDARFTCHVSELSPLSKSLAHVSVEVAANATGSERLGLLFQGNVGNTGNFGGNGTPGGSGFPGRMGFVVEVSETPDDPTLETKMAKAEDIIGRYRNTLQVLAK